jgi:hypothetical protein
MLRRKRKCSECNKPLGGTVGKCYECGGEKPERTRKERLADAKEWKLLLGVKYALIKEAHAIDGASESRTRCDSTRSQATSREGDNE